MSVIDALRTLVKGERPSAGLLHTCRFEGLGVETYGIEAILERIRMAPFDIATDACVIETPRHIAVFDAGRAIFADVANGNLGRLWVLGSNGFDGAEQTLAVPFDPDLAQAGTDIFFAIDDHIDLADDAGASVEALGRAVIAEAGAPQTRAFAIRAFGSADRGAVLFAVSRIAPGRNRVAGFAMTAACWENGVQHFARDVAGETALAAGGWTPRIAG